MAFNDHAHHGARAKLSVLLVSKSFSKVGSHAGLGISGLNNQKSLRAAGIEADQRSITSAGDLAELLKETPRSHVVISAPWIATEDVRRMLMAYPNTKFFVVSHSNIGFLQADSNGVKLIREGIELEAGTHNFHVAGNSRKYCEIIQAMYCAPCAYLPNVYYLDGHTRLHPPSFCHGSTLRIGAFGATRPLKNLMSAAAAALEIARDFRCPLEMWMNSGRAEGGGEVVMRSIQAMLSGLPNVTLRFTGWQSWPQFRETVGSMHLLLQPSYTESFNMVTADGVSRGVPSVVSSAIDWVPPYWHAEVDDVQDIARVGKHLLTYHRAVNDGLEALKRHNEQGLAAWLKALGVK